MHTRIVKQTREVINDFCRTELHNKQYYVLNTSDFCDYIAKHKAIKIEIQENGNMKTLRGMILSSSIEKKALVLLSNINNPCWNRFTLIKEVTHLFLEYEVEIENDNALLMAESLMDHVAFLPNFLPESTTCNHDNELLKELLEKVELLMNKRNPIGAEETSAVVAAIEILIPVSSKIWIKEWIARGCYLNDISSKLMVPNLILEYRLKEWFIDIPPLKK